MQSTTIESLTQSTCSRAVTLFTDDCIDQFRTTGRKFSPVCKNVLKVAAKSCIYVGQKFRKKLLHNFASNHPLTFGKVVIKFLRLQYKTHDHWCCCVKYPTSYDQYSLRGPSPSQWTKPMHVNVYKNIHRSFINAIFSKCKFSIFERLNINSIIIYGPIFSYSFFYSNPYKNLYLITSITPYPT